ncbi:hypothetical protein QR680_016493 [Steinernema hermaphroditum]|uniref:Uncharacterized protein n=1 Tax=Steinernema hermaphroditum TaxID=289476 RepID=A0AA39HCD8_9BILA|nr:hypothetical protein QR680_016493 [Steinernema hermaphroditum]
MSPAVSTNFKAHQSLPPLSGQPMKRPGIRILRTAPPTRGPDGAIIRSGPPFQLPQGAQLKGKTVIRSRVPPVTPHQGHMPVYSPPMTPQSPLSPRNSLHATPAPYHPPMHQSFSQMSYQYMTPPPAYQPKVHSVDSLITRRPPQSAATPMRSSQFIHGHQYAPQQSVHQYTPQPACPPNTYHMPQTAVTRHQDRPSPRKVRTVPVAASKETNLDDGYKMTRENDMEFLKEFFVMDGGLLEMFRTAKYDQ